MWMYSMILCPITGVEFVIWIEKKVNIYVFLGVLIGWLWMWLFCKFGKASVFVFFSSLLKPLLFFYFRFWKKKIFLVSFLLWFFFMYMYFFAWCMVLMWFFFYFFYGGEDGSIPEGGEAESKYSDWWEWDSDYQSGKHAQLYHLWHEPPSCISLSLSLSLSFYFLFFCMVVLIFVSFGYAIIY